jgi:hypothetical protein
MALDSGDDGTDFLSGSNHSSSSNSLYCLTSDIMQECLDMITINDTDFHKMNLVFMLPHLNV